MSGGVARAWAANAARSVPRGRTRTQPIERRGREDDCAVRAGEARGQRARGAEVWMRTTDARDLLP